MVGNNVGRRKIGLDYLRAAAILCVLAAHTAGQKPLGALGFIGVEIFFVLSGYLIGGILLASYARHGNAPSWPILREFWLRRWLRTLPNYFLFLPIYVLADHYGLKTRLPLYATFTQNLGWPIHDFFGVSWSLAVEEWFYLLLPIFIALSFRIVGRLRPAMIATVLVLFLVPFILRLTLCQGHPFDGGMRKVVVFRLDALMWGVALATAQRYRPGIFNRLASPVCVPIGLVGMALASWWVWIHYRQQHAFPATVGGALILTAASFCCALVLPYCSSIPWKKSLFNRCAYLVSVWSYSLYLSHPLIIWRVGAHLGDPQFHNPLVIVIAWLLTFAISAAVYYSFERPILRWRDWITERRVKSVQVAAAL
jgi:peptidoglycan/LPS O-acetylase OafA/YrhL